MLSRDDIKKAIVEGSIKIHPFDERNLTGLGYNLSTTKFAFSVNWQILLEIRKDVDANGDVSYVDIPPNDTVLFFTREYVEVDNTVAGTLHSKVSRVCQGLGHISTTLDPTWRGQLIVSVNNPTSKPIKFVLDKDGGNVLTLIFHRLDTPVSGADVHDNNRGRCELLLEHFKSRGEGAKDRRKYAELERFVLETFAVSLNGDDDPLGTYARQDAASKRARQLEVLSDRLRSDSGRFRNREHLDGSQPVYCVSGDPDDDKLIRSCALFRLEPDESLFEPIQLSGKKSEENVCGTVERCLRIVAFELESIEHARRIRWQDDEIAKFASADSLLAELKREEERRTFWRAEWPHVVAAAGAMVVAAALLILVALSGTLGWGGEAVAALVVAAAGFVANAVGVLAGVIGRRPSRRSVGGSPIKRKE